jgi:hypothetical protein
MSRSDKHTIATHGCMMPDSKQPDDSPKLKPPKILKVIKLSQLDWNECEVGMEFQCRGSRGFKRY